MSFARGSDYSNPLFSFFINTQNLGNRPLLLNDYNQIKTNFGQFEIVFDRKIRKNVPLI